MLCVSSSSVTDSTVPSSPRELRAIGVCAKGRRVGLLPIEGMWVNPGNVSKDRWLDIIAEPGQSMCGNVGA